MRTEPGIVEMYSAASRVYRYLLHLISARASVRWVPTLIPTSASSSELRYGVEVTLPPVLAMLGRLVAYGAFLRRHVDEESPAFAADISRKHIPASDRESLVG